MALTQCKECKKEVSDDAKACPHCGYTGIIRDRKKAETDAVMATTGGKITYAVILGLIFWGLYSCMSGSSERTAAYNQCIEKGKAYFKEIGSWPRLSDGRDAEVVAAQRCSNTHGAFGN